MKQIKIIQMMLLASVLATSNHALSSSGSSSAAPKATTAAKPTGPKKSALTETQKAEQAALPFGKRMASKTGEGLGFESRGRLLTQKSKLDVKGKERSFETTEQLTQSLDFKSDAVTKSGRAEGERTYVGAAKDALVNTGFALGLAKTKQITTRVKDTKGIETGEIRVDTVNKNGELVHTTVYAPGRKSFQQFRPDGKIIAELTPDGRRIENTYEGTTLTSRREVTENTLNFRNNKTSKYTTFFNNGEPRTTIIKKGSGLLETTLTQEFTEGKPLEYKITDNKGNLVETRVQEQNGTYLTKNGQGEVLQTARINQTNNTLQSLEFTDPATKSKTSIIFNENGSSRTTVRNAADKIISDITLNANGTAQVTTVVPETWTLSGGLIGTGRDMSKTSIIEKGGKAPVDQGITFGKPESIQSKIETTMPDSNSRSREVVESGMLTQTPPPVPLNAPKEDLSAAATTGTEGSNS